MSVADLAFHLDTAASPTTRRALARLAGEVFGLDLSPLDRLGHDPDFVSFGWWEGDDLVAHVGLAAPVLWLDGRPIAARAVQFVAVRPDRRGRGLFRDLMTRALAAADAEVDLVLLMTETPALYMPFGFNAVTETVFAGPLRPSDARPNHRRLSLDDSTDVRLIRESFARRTPVSLRCGLIEDPAPLLLKAIESPEIALEHLPDLDAIVAIEPGGRGELVLLDVIAAEIPPLAAIAAALGGGCRRARVAVTPDRLDWRAEIEAPEDTGLMVRGPFLPEGTSFALSPMRV